MPCRPSASTSRTRWPSAASDRASAPAMVVFPVPPLPVTMCNRTSRNGCGTEPVTTATYPAGPHLLALRLCPRPPRPSGVRPPPRCAALVSPTMQKWEYVTVPLLSHATKQILDGWGDQGFELVTVLPGPTGEQLVAYLKRPIEQ